MTIKLQELINITETVEILKCLALKHNNLHTVEHLNLANSIQALIWNHKNILKK